MTSLFPFNDYFLTRTVKLGHLHIVSYGTKVSVLAGNGSGYKYPGSFVYSVSSGGTETLESIACDEGKITVSYRTGGSVSYYDQVHFRDHLGSTRMLMDITLANLSPSIAVLEKSDYTPFGTRVPITSSTTNRWRFSGKEEQAIDGNDPGQLDFGARHYDPWLARWTTQDPLAGKYTSFTPYSYCAGNPVNMVDLDGQAITDYFDSSGKFLFTDGVDNGIIKITSSQTVEMAKELLSSDMINSYIDDNSVSFHYAFFSGIIDENSSLKIFNHYNRTGLSLDIDNKLSGYMEFNNKGENNSVRISVNINKSLNPNKQGFTLDNYHDISNAMNVHEGKGHYEKYKKLGPIKYSAIPSHLREISAIQLQMQDPSWKNTTELYKEGVKGYYQQQRKKTKQNDTSN